MKITKKQVMEIINNNKENTSYFNKTLKLSDMVVMLRYNMGFGVAETKIILAALINAGAKFQIDDDLNNI